MRCEPCGLCRFAGPDLVRVPPSAFRFHSLAGQRQHLLLPATAGWRLAATNRSRERPRDEVDSQHQRHCRGFGVYRAIAGVVGQHRQCLEHVYPAEPLRGTRQGWADRRRHFGQTASKQLAAANIQEAYVGVFGMPPVDGLGTLGGFKLQVEDRGNVGLSRRCKRRPPNWPPPPCRTRAPGGLALTTFRAGVPQVYLDVDRAKAESMHVPLDRSGTRSRSIWARFTSTTSPCMGGPTT